MDVQIGFSPVTIKGSRGRKGAFSPGTANPKGDEIGSLPLASMAVGRAMDKDIQSDYRDYR